MRQEMPVMRTLWTIEDIQEMAGKLWENERGHSAELAKAMHKAHPVPVFAKRMSPNLVQVLADVQRRSFAHGVTAALCAVNIPLTKELEPELETVEGEKAQ